MAATYPGRNLSNRLWLLSKFSPNLDTHQFNTPFLKNYFDLQEKESSITNVENIV